jgi:hypothetical protein
MRNNIINRVYSIVNKKNIYNRKNHFTYGWADNPLSVLEYFHEQKSLPLSKRCIENGDYVVLFHDRDSGAFGHAIWGDDPSYKQRTYRME